mgnify:CR=1 FL=1
MSPSGAEVIRQIKSQVEEVDPAQVSEHLGNGIVLVPWFLHELYGDTFFDLINQAPDIDLLLPDPDGTPFASSNGAIA